MRMKDFGVILETNKEINDILEDLNSWKKLKNKYEIDLSKEEDISIPPDWRQKIKGEVIKLELIKPPTDDLIIPKENIVTKIKESNFDYFLIKENNKVICLINNKKIITEHKTYLFNKNFFSKLSQYSIIGIKIKK